MSLIKNLAMVSSIVIASPINAAPMYATSASAAGFDWTVYAHVKATEVSGSPGTVDFQTDVACGSCPAGNLLYWYSAHHATDVPSQIQSASAVESVLITAQVTGRQVLLYGSNSGCEINYIYLN